MKLNSEFSLKDFGVYTMEEEITKEFLLFMVVGNGQIKVTLFDQNNLIIKSKSIEIFVDEILMLPINLNSLPGLSNGRIEFLLEVKLPVENQVFIIASQTDAISTKYNSVIKINSTFINYLFIEV